MKKLLSIILVTLFFSSSYSSFCQTEQNENAQINFYRVQESMMSGGRGLTVKIYFNDKEITSLLTNTKMTYKLHSAGTVKIKCVAEFAGGGVGSPYVETLELEKGKEYHISLSAGSMTGVKGEIIDGKKLKKILKKKFTDTIELEEDK